MTEIVIYRGADDTAITTAVVNKDSKRKQLLGEDDYITVKFSSAKPLYFTIGDYCYYQNELFIISEQLNCNPTLNTKTSGYDYELQFDAEYYTWRNKIFKYAPQSGSPEVSWSLTDTLDKHMSIFLANLQADGVKYKGKDYVFEIDSTVSTEAKLITYTNTSRLDALSAMAEQWACDVWVSEGVIHFGRCEFANADGSTKWQIEHGINAKITSSSSRDTYATRIFAFGSTRNLPSSYRPSEADVVQNGVVERHLMLPKGTPYVDAWENMAESEVVEDIVVFDSVYPRTKGTIKAVTTKNYIDTDTIDGEEVQTTWQAYRFTFKDTFAFRQAYILDTELHIIFKSGKLDGMDFAVLFNPDGVTDETSAAGQMFEIVRNDTYGVNLPNDTLYPAEGDEFVLYGFDATKITEMEMVAEAEQELLEKANEYKEKVKIDPNTYDCEIYESYAKERGETVDDEFIMPFALGDAVELINAAFFRTGSRRSRIIGIEYQLDKPEDNPTITVGESATYSRYDELSDTVDAVAASAAGVTTASSGASIYIISSNDNTTPSNKNVYSALRAKQEFLNARAKDTAEKTITFVEGAEFGNYTAGASGGAITVDAETGEVTADIDRLYVRLKAYFESLEIVNVNSIGGEQTISPAGAITIAKVEKLSGVYRCYFLAEQEGVEVENRWQAKDQAYCQTFNVKSGITQGATNHFYWRLVEAASAEAVEVGGKKYHYIDLSMTSYADGSDEPLQGDVVAHRGSQGDDVKRQTLMVFSSVAAAAPSIILYKGVNSFSLADKDMVSIGYDATKGHAFLRSYGDAYFGDRSKQNSYFEYDAQQQLLRIKAELEILSTSTIGGKTLNDYITSAVPYTNRNYFLNSGFTNQLKHYTIYSSLTCAITNTVTHGGNSSLYLKGEANDSAMYRSFYQRFDSVKAGSPIAFSVWAYFNTIPATRAVRFIFEKRKSDGTSAYSNLYLNPTAAGEWQQFSIIGTLPEDCTALLIWLRLENEGDEVYISSPKLEYDSKVTEWIAAPEDISELNAAVTDAAATAQQTADAAKERIASWADDGVVSPVEKKQVYQEVLSLIADKNELLKQGTCYGLGLNGNYLNAFNAYYKELYAIYTSTDDVVTLPDDFKTVVNTYYTERTTQVEQIANAAKDYVDTSIANIDVDVDTLTDLLAREQTTSITGGLILTSKIKVGTGNTTNDDGTVTQTTTKAGLNGIVSSTTTPVIWAGGEMVDLQYDKLQTPSKIIPAKFLIRADGTGYAAGNTVKFQSSEVTVGSNDQVSLNKNGLQLKDTDGNVRMMLTNQSITTDADILSAPRTVASDPVTLSSTYSGTNPQNTSATVIEANLAKGDEWGIMISSTPSQLSLAYKMTIEVYRKATDDDSDDTLVLSATATSAAGVAKVNTAYTADADGDYYIIAKIVGTGTASGDMKDYTMTFNVFVALSLDFGTNNLQGTNGVFVSFGSSAFILRSDLALMRTGRGGIRVIDGDVQIQKDGKTWKSL